MRRTSNAAVAEHAHRGFTIVELLIVVVVIAILAAITIVSYNGISNRAKASSAQQGASQAAKKVLAYAVDNADTYPAASGANGAGALAALGISTTGGTDYQYSVDNSANPRFFCITATTGDQSYWVSSANTSPKSGGCPGHGQGGVAAMTNWAPNPGATGSTSGFGFWAGNTGNVATADIVPATWTASGSAYRVTWSAVGSPSTGDLQVLLTGGGLTAGKKYTLSYKMRGPNRASTVGAQAMYSSSGTITTHALSQATDQALSSNQIVTRWITFTADAAAFGSGLRAVQNLTAKVAGDTLQVGEVLIYEGDYKSSTQWAWGDSPNWAWNGAPNNSSSSGPPL